MSTECANLRPRGARQRAAMGVVMLVAGLALGAWLVGSDLDRLWRLALLPLFFFSGLGFFQAGART